MRKIYTTLLTLIMLFIFSVSASAVTHAQYGLEAEITPSVSVDSVSFGISVENISKENIDGIFIDCIFPDGLSPVTETKKVLGNLSANEKADFTVNAALTSAPLTLNVNGQGQATPLSFFSVIGVVIVLTVLLLLILLAVKNKHIKKTLAIFLCILFAIPSLGFIPTFAKNNSESFTVSETVKLRGVDYTVDFTIGFSSKSPSDEIICKTTASVSDATQDISGTIVSDEEISSVSYKVYSEIDKGAVSFEGTAMLDGGHYIITDTVLKPDSNEIKLSAKTKSGKLIEDTVNIYYDSSSLYEYTDSDISVDKDSGRKYINSIINVLFTADATDEQKEATVNSLNAEKVGYINGAKMWQLKIDTTDLDGLNAICNKLQNLSYVESAYIDYLDLTTTVTPDDPWGGSSWSEASPAGNNWSVEMVKALSAWDYNDYFNNINLGMVDSGCDYDHEDLVGRILFSSTSNESGCDKQNHGTHVSGIMAATANNGIGCTGILWNGKLYVHDASPNSSTTMTTTSCYQGIVQNVEAGAKVVNLSVGLSTITTLTETDISNFSINASSYMAQLLNAGYDFIVCQSAGNGDANGTAVDTEMNGMFCCVDIDNTIQNASMARKIVDRIMIVGSMSSGGTLSTSSNYGNHVDLAAPGVSIYSSIIGDYGKMSGTSMSSPLVAAMLGVVWSVNPELDGGEVADILLTSANNYRSAYAATTGQSALPVPNLLTAVEAAIATLPANDFTELDKAISLVPSDTSFYTAESLEALNTAYQTALSLDRENVSQNLIDEITADLLSAIYSLKVKLASPAEITVPDTITAGNSSSYNIRFNCNGAENISIKFDNDNIVASSQSGTSNTATISISGNKLTESDIGTITCTVTYDYQGVTHTLHRYIEVIGEIFATEALVDTSIKRSGGNWLSGYNPNLYNIATITGTAKAFNPSANSSNGYFDYSNNAFICDSTTAAGTQWGGYQLAGSSSSNLMDENYAPKGYLYVDKNSYTQLSEIPNLSVYIYQYKQCARASGGTEVLSITTYNENYYVNVEDTVLGTSQTSSGGSQTYKINGPVPNKTTTVRFYIQTRATANGITSNPTTSAAIFLDLVIVPQDKAELSALLNSAYEANHQSLFYTESSFATYLNALKNAASAYANPYSEQSEIDKAYKNLSEAILGLTFAKSADYSELDSLITTAEKYNFDLYTDYSLEILTDTLYKATGLERSYFVAYQSVIDDAVSSLEDAIAQLLLCGDVNADGSINGNDAFIMSCILSGSITKETIGEYKYSAADADKNGTVNYIDYNIIFNKGLMA